MKPLIESQTKLNSFFQTIVRLPNYEEVFTSRKKEFVQNAEFGIVSMRTETKLKGYKVRLPVEWLGKAN